VNAFNDVFIPALLIIQAMSNLFFIFVQFKDFCNREQYADDIHDIKNFIDRIESIK